jgi:GNAT superfamily N-acetyltransferase
MEDKGIKSYFVDGQTFDIKESDANDFLKDFPQAKEVVSFKVGNDTLDIDVNETESFLKDVPTAQRIYGGVEKKNAIGNVSPTGGKVGASETPSIGSSPFLQKAKQRVEEGAPTVLSIKKEIIKPIGQPSYTPTKEEELNAPTQKQFEEQAVSPYENLTPLQIAQKQTKIAIERSNALDELIKAKKESQPVLNKVLELDKEIESYEPQFEAFKTASKTFQPDIQAYKNTSSQINDIKKRSKDLILAFNKESETLKPKMDSYVSIFQNDKLPEQKRKEAYEAYSGLFSMLSNKEKLLNKAIADNESSLPGLKEQLLSYDDVIKKATANQKGFSSLYDKYKSLIDERNILANELGGYQKKQEDAQRLIKEKLFEQSNLEDIRQNKAEKEYSVLQNLFESLPKVGIETVAGFADIMNTLGLAGDPESPEIRDEVKEQTRQNTEKLRKFGESFITQELPKNYEKFFEGDFSIKKLANLGINGIASTAPTIVAGLLGGPAAGVVAGSSMAFGESKEIMKEAGLSDDKAEYAALGLSIPIGLLENYGAEDIVKLFSKDAISSATKIFLKNIAGRNLTKEQLFNEAKNTIGQLIKEGAPQLVKEGFKEGLTEPLQGTVNEVAKQLGQKYTGVDLDKNLSWSDYLKEQAKVRGEEAIGGFLSGTTMYGGGVALKAGYQAVFPTFNPSAYNKALELLDPNKMEAFKEEVAREVEDKVLTPEQAELAFKNIELIQQTDKLIPNSISNKDLKTEALNLLIEKKDIETEIEGKDDALVSPQKNRIKEINSRLSDIAQGKQEAVVEEQPSQPIITKNTTPTDEKYGTIDRGDGKGVIDLTRAEYEAEIAKQQPAQAFEEIPEISEEKKSLESEILSEEEFINKTKNNRNFFRKILDKIGGVSYDKYLKNAKEKLTLLEKNPLAYFEKELNAEIEWGKKDPSDINEGLIEYYKGAIEKLKNQQQKQPTAEEVVVDESPAFETDQTEAAQPIELSTEVGVEKNTIEDKRKETESKIKRKDLFEGVGNFSTELGGSDKAAVPVSHKEINGIEFVEYAHPITGSVDVIVTGTSDRDFVGFYRIYENGKPTNKWSSKFENQSRNKENFKTMINGVQQMLPKGHQYTEKTSISTDGLRIWNQQLNRGYELQYDENGKLITNQIAINGDAIVNELGIPVEKGSFENIRIKTEEDFKKVKEKLLPYLEKFGLGENNIKWLSETVKIDLPVLKKTEPTTEAAPSVEPSQEERKQSEAPTGNYEIAQEATRVVSEENPDASVLLTPKGEDLSLTAVFVKNEKRNKGVGTKVLESVKKQADKLGKKVVLDATTEFDEETDLERLGNFYERNGFEKIGENKFEYTPKETPQAGSVGVVDNLALKDVESTAKALEGKDLSNIPRKAKGYEDTTDGTVGYGQREQRVKTKTFKVAIDGYGSVSSQSFIEKLVSAGRLGKEFLSKKTNRFTDEFYNEQFNKNIDLFERQFEGTKEIAEAYHKAKKDGSNRELVKAVEEAIGKQSLKETPQAGSVGVGGDAMPLEGYHYTDKDFTEFEQPTETQSLGNGTYFYLNKRKSTKKEVTSELNVKKILDWKELKDEERSTIIKELEKAKIPTDRLNDGKLIRKVFNNIDDAKKFSSDKKAEGLNVKTDLVDGEYIVEYKEKGLSNASNDKLRGLAAEFDPNIAKRLGYDAAKLGDEIVVFDVKNTKIKTAEQSKETPKASSGVGGEVEEKVSGLQHTKSQLEEIAKEEGIDNAIASFKKDLDVKENRLAELTKYEKGKLPSQKTKSKEIQSLEKRIEEVRKDVENLEKIKSEQSLKETTKAETPQAGSVNEFQYVIDKANKGGENAKGSGTKKVNLSDKEAAILNKTIEKLEAKAVENNGASFDESETINVNYEKVNGKEQKINTYNIDGYEIKYKYNGGKSFTEIRTPQGDLIVVQKQYGKTEISYLGNSKETPQAGSVGVGGEDPVLANVEATTKALEGVAMGSPQKIIQAAKAIDKIEYVEEQEARDIIESYTHYKSGNQKSPATRWAGWFQSVNAANKKFIVDDIQNDPKLRNAMLSLFYDVYKAEFNFNGTFNDFLNTEITLYRGITLADKKGVGQEGFSAFSTTKNRVMPYADEQALGKGQIKEIKIKPKDTYGAVNYIGGGEVEVLVPTDFKKETLKNDFNRLVELNISLFNEEQLNYIEKLYDKEDYISGIAFAKSVIFSNPKKLSEAYHKAKADGSNPELVKAVEQSLKATPQATENEKITQEEDGQPLPEGVSSVRTETEERKTSAELRAEEKEVRSTIDNAVANFYAINEATKRSEKREAAKEFRQNLEKMPTVKNVFDNIKSIFAQLEAEGIITKSKDCP